MNPFEMVLGIVLIFAIAGIIKSRSGSRHSESSARDEQAAAEDAQRIRELEERVRVLETIITDRRGDLKREIDRL